ncbi:pentapeptide repeat-containing protein [Mycobacterium tuberculosis]|nr:Uncharacterised protein [Mycobacterium tuberculosis]SGB12597.1 pentapeptide repeat-containing protein [Mycobacterium tuberculosis]SGB40007.1 pentapeptide repeat-containing protein [Mycobacterium tuberculosis]SGB66532.1 pentapeptide repeat-containing protein [Mycobacterium tuberculosis]SGC61666.1 pentapeptide repeat-containing protein [Mycobacterium tuberculosis]
MTGARVAEARVRDALSDRAADAGVQVPRVEAARVGVARITPSRVVVAGVSEAEVSRTFVSTADVEEAGISAAEVGVAVVSVAEVEEAGVSAAQVCIADVAVAEVGVADIPDAEVVVAGVAAAHVVVADVADAQEVPHADVLDAQGRDRERCWDPHRTGRRGGHHGRQDTQQLLPRGQLRSHRRGSTVITHHRRHILCPQLLIGRLGRCDRWQILPKQIREHQRQQLVAIGRHQCWMCGRCPRGLIYCGRSLGPGSRPLSACRRRVQPTQIRCGRGRHRGRRRTLPRRTRPSR